MKPRNPAAARWSGVLASAAATCALTNVPGIKLAAACLILWAAAGAAYSLYKVRPNMEGPSYGSASN